MLRLLPDVKVALFIAEEVGCVGSNAVDLKFFDDVSFVLQADRKDASDFIVHTNGTKVSSTEFQTAVKEYLDLYEFKLCEHGSSTDVGKLVTRDLGICVANISSGYYGAHSTEEKVCKSDLENTMNMMYKIASDSEIAKKRWLFTPPKTTFQTYNAYNRNHNHYTREDKGGSDFAGQNFQCNTCTDWNCMCCPVAKDNTFFS